MIITLSFTFLWWEIKYIKQSVDYPVYIQGWSWYLSRILMRRATRSSEVLSTGRRTVGCTTRWLYSNLYRYGILNIYPIHIKLLENVYQYILARLFNRPILAWFKSYSLVIIRLWKNPFYSYELSILILGGKCSYAYCDFVSKFKEKCIIYHHARFMVFWSCIQCMKSILVFYCCFPLF